ncbi:MAG: hypothetical protein K0R17_3549 [Rariglobus sp.]|jgi:hypothetical protein|nr:hypothetical protein [Rariglobus sp.]
MKKLLHFLTAFVIAALVGTFAFDAWQTTAYVRKEGLEGTLLVGDRYNASRWAAPLPLKKLNTYTATLFPRREVVVESDQDLAAGRKYFIRVLTPGQAVNAPAARLRPIPGRIRPRTSHDHAPVKVDGTQHLDRMLDAAVGSARTDTSPPTAVQTPTLEHGDFVPFVLVEADESLFETLWRNSRAGEWLAAFLALILCKVLFIQACAQPWRIRRSPSERKDFVHPSLRPIDPDPIPASPQRITLPSKPVDPPPEPAAQASAAPTGPALKLPRTKPDGQALAGPTQPHSGSRTKLRLAAPLHPPDTRTASRFQPSSSASTPPSLRTFAEFYIRGLAEGFATTTEVIAWANDVIATAAKTEDWMLAISTATLEDRTGVLHHLHAVQGTVDEAALAALLAAKK